jgi:hypothetical protein
MDSSEKTEGVRCCENTTDQIDLEPLSKRNEIVKCFDYRDNPKSPIKCRCYRALQIINWTIAHGVSQGNNGQKVSPERINIIGDYWLGYVDGIVEDDNDRNGCQKGQLRVKVEAVD